ncbi:TIR domain-containing protein [Phaeobacter sp. JH20_10]|uniref:TIR domain-containing protein n=1 Tax=Phaeobacter sp. JH20_10 TaxID=3112469 RepID=UPI003A859912
MAYRNKVFVSFDGDNDISYYRLMLAWKQSDHSSFNFYNAHDVSSARDTSTELSIKASLQTRLRETKVFVLLVGGNTKYLYKFVRWEIEQALKRGLPIICVNLNGVRNLDGENCPAILRDELAMHVSFNAKMIEYALDNWPSQHAGLTAKSETGPYYYKKEIYSSLGIT